MKEPKASNRRVDPSTTVLYDSEPRAVGVAAPDRGKCIQIEVLGGPQDGQVRRVAKAIMTVGRSEANDLSLPLDPMVSAAHARVVREGEHFWLEDLGSRNGTYFGDERIRGRSLIAPGTNFTVGRTRLEFTPR